MITVKGGGGVLNNPPTVSELKVVGEPTQTSISISYKVTDAELQITRHYLTVNGVYNKKEITKEVGYEMPDNLFTYTITGLTKATEYTIQIMCDDGLAEGNSNPLQAETKDIILYSFTITEADSNPATRVAYGDDAVGVTPANNTGLGGWEDKWPFNVIRIVGLQNGKITKEIKKENRAQYTDGTAVDNSPTSNKDITNVMTEFPTIYWRKSAPSGQIKFEVSDAPLVGGDCYAHKMGDVIRPTIYVGSYLGFSYPYNGKSYLTSMRAQRASDTITLTSFRNYAHNLGSGYELLNFNILTMLQILFTLAYRNTNSQAALGMGYVGASSKRNTGGTDTKGWVYGSTSGTEQMCFLGIEDLWGNLFQWVDGLKIDANSNIWICTDNMNFNNTGTGTGWENIGTSEVISSRGWMSRINTSQKTGFFAKTISGSSSTYYADEIVSENNSFADFGGYYDDTSYAGIFSLNSAYDAGSGSGYRGARLVYIGEVN